VALRVVAAEDSVDKMAADASNSLPDWRVGIFRFLLTVLILFNITGAVWTIIYYVRDDNNYPGSQPSFGGGTFLIFMIYFDCFLVVYVLTSESQICVSGVVIF
jgi:hypothetical protein